MSFEDAVIITSQNNVEQKISKRLRFSKAQIAAAFNAGFVYGSTIPVFVGSIPLRIEFKLKE